MSAYRIIEGDLRDRLGDLEPGSVQTCVTSPPYWGLRDYGTAAWSGGDPECDHLGPPKASERSGLKNDGRPEPGRKGYELTATVPYRDTCGKCGATRIDSQLGLEPTPERYVENLVSVFREVKRVLRDDGTLWLNLGDSYASNPHSNQGSPSSTLLREPNRRNRAQTLAKVHSDLTTASPSVRAAAQRGDR